MSRDRACNGMDGMAVSRDRDCNGMDGMVTDAVGWPLLQGLSVGVRLPEERAVGDHAGADS